MPRFIDLTGQRYHRLTVISVAGKNTSGKIQWNCMCDCGKAITTTGNGIKSGNTKSCGCWHIDAISTHKAKHHILYPTWKSMRNRCSNTADKNYANYGGRGIFVCQEWLDDPFVFFSNMGDRPDNSTLDRIDNNKGYYPENCRWATMLQQQNNRRGNMILIVNGIRRTATQWSRVVGIKPDTIHHRIKYGWSDYSAVMTPVYHARVSE